MSNCLEKYDNMGYRAYTTKSELDKILHTLEGILKGISLDSIITIEEIAELKNWCEFHRESVNKHPFNELIPLIDSAVADNELTDEEIKDILWLCSKLKSNSNYYDSNTGGIQRLQGILHGILSDNVITDSEVYTLREWLNEHEYLSGCYPYDEVYSLLSSILADNIITDEERNILKVFFSEFVDLDRSINLDKNEIEQLRKEITVEGVCALCPEIIFEGNKFCFTGKSSKTNRQAIANIINSLHGKYINSVSTKTNYLIIGNEGNPCWAYSCYGRKVEEAINLRKAGHKVTIVHENDFWDAIEDLAE